LAAYKLNFKIIPWRIAEHYTVYSFSRAFTSKDFLAMQKLFAKPHRLYEENGLVKYIDDTQANEPPDAHIIVYQNEVNYTEIRFRAFDLKDINHATVYMISHVLYHNGKVPIYYTYEIERKHFRWLITYIQTDI